MAIAEYADNFVSISDMMPILSCISGCGEVAIRDESGLTASERAKACEMEIGACPQPRAIRHV